jgi:hypothetical protein
VAVAAALLRCCCSCWRRIRVVTLSTIHFNILCARCERVPGTATPPGPHAFSSGSKHVLLVEKLCSNHGRIAHWTIATARAARLLFSELSCPPPSDAPAAHCSS